MSETTASTGANGDSKTEPSASSSSSSSSPSNSANNGNQLSVPAAATSLTLKKVASPMSIPLDSIKPDESIVSNNVNSEFKAPMAKDAQRKTTTASNNDNAGVEEPKKRSVQALQEEEEVPMGPLLRSPRVHSFSPLSSPRIVSPRIPMPSPRTNLTPRAAEQQQPQQPQQQQQQPPPSITTTSAAKDETSNATKANEEDSKTNKGVKEEETLPTNITEARSPSPLPEGKRLPPPDATPTLLNAIAPDPSLGSISPSIEPLVTSQSLVSLIPEELQPEPQRQQEEATATTTQSGSTSPATTTTEATSATTTTTTTPTEEKKAEAASSASSTTTPAPASSSAAPPVPPVTPNKKDNSPSKMRNLRHKGETTERALDQSKTPKPAISFLFERVSRRRLIPWIGAGVTYSIYGGWETVVRIIWEEAGCEEEFDKLKNSEDLTILAQVGGGRLEQQGKDMWECLEKKFDKLEAKAKSRKINRRSIWDSTLDDLNLLVHGPWPAMLTTNWDATLEQSFARSYGYAEDIDHRKKIGNYLPVRFRKDVHLFYAELKADRKPPMLLKLHGDFTDEGKKELVLSHADYRAVMIRDIALNELLRQLSSEYSFFFIGSSVRDRDLLSVLDQVSEGLGSGIGPHFWLTPDAVSDFRAEHLRVTYNIYTIHFDEKLPFEERVDLFKTALRELHMAGWMAPTPNVLTTRKEVRYCSPFKRIDIPFPQGLGKVRILVKAMKAKKQRGHAAASVGLKSGGDQLYYLLGDEPYRSIPALESGGVYRWLTLGEGRYHIWLLCGHGPDRAGKSGHVFRATLSFLLQACEAYEDALEINKNGKKLVRLSLPLIASGGGALTSKHSLCAILSAIGYFLGFQYHGLPGNIRLCIDIYLAMSNQASSDNLLAEISEGRLLPNQILSRASFGQMKLQCIYLASHCRYITKTVFISIYATVAELLDELRVGNNAGSGHEYVRVKLGTGPVERTRDLSKKDQQTFQLLEIGVGEEALIEIQPITSSSYNTKQPRRHSTAWVHNAI